MSGGGYAVVAAIALERRKEICKALMDRGIEVEGLPRHGGKDGSGGLGAAMGRHLEETLERGRAGRERR